eukprot:s1240_g7.t3
MGSSNKLRQGLAPLPMIRNAAGTFCKTAEEALERWITFFGEMEGGTRHNDEQQRALWLSHLSGLLRSELSVDILEVPSLSELEYVCRHVAAGKASGLDGVPSDLCRRCPDVVARLLYSLMLKAGVQGQEALAHKGGVLLPIWKGRQQCDECSAFRSILLSSSLGKVMHKSLRTKQMQLYERFLQRQQIGGRAGVPVVLGSHMVRAFQRLCTQLKRPSALLFIDLQEAFYRVVRPLVTESVITDELLAMTAQRIGLAPGFLHDLHQALGEPCALRAAQVPEHLRRAISALHQDTYFKLPFQEDRVITQLGSRPGDSFADIIYGYLMARVLKKFEDDMTARGILLSVPLQEGLQLDVDSEASSSVPFVGPCWMDDLCICLQAESNHQLEQHVGTASGAILDLFKSHAMTPNLKPGKTALLVTPRGPGTQRFKERLFGSTAPDYWRVLGEHHSYDIPVVRTYTHLGGQVHFSTQIKKEIKARFAVAHQAFNKHRKLLYQNQLFSMDKKRELFQSLILSRLLYGAETWVLLDVKTKMQLHGGILALCKRLLGLPHDSHLTDDEVLYQVGLPSPTDLLRQKRLRYLGSLYSVGSTACWGLLNQDRDWLLLVRDDFRWMWAQLQNCCSLGDPDSHLPRWLEIIRWHRSYWKRLIRRASQHSIGRQAREFYASEAQMRFLHRLETAGWLTFPRPHGESPQLLGHYGCMSCRTSCRSLGGEGAHMNRAHGVVHPVRTLIGSTQCGACLREYYTHGKLKMHLIRSAECRRALIGRRQWELPLPGIGSTEDGERLAAWDNRHHPLPAQGPRLPAAGAQDFPVEHPELFEALALRLAEEGDVVQLEKDLIDLVQAKPISWTLCRSTLEELVTVILQDAESGEIPANHEQVAVLRRLADPSAWPFLMMVRPDPGGGTPSLPAVDDIIDHVELSASPVVVSRPVGRERVFLHAFSGRRRPGDLQHYLEAAFQRDSGDGGLTLHVVSMDVVIDPCWGDARRKETQRFWLDGVLAGYVLGGLCGPPCETWSQARFNEVDSAVGRGPRPVRSAGDLWGLPSLTLRELQQVAVGNDLLLFSFELIICLAISGGHGVLEHPSEPSEDDRPSIWRLALVHLLLQLPGVASFTLAQGLLGARTPKPTRLLTVNMPDLPRCIQQHRISPDLPKRIAIGRQDDSSWATAGLKEYPPAFNKALAECFISNFLRRSSDPLASTDEAFLRRCEHLCSELCYFREFEAARQLRALQDRAQAAQLPWPSWTARLALSQRAPYWCVVFHEASGAVLGSHRCAYQRLRSQPPTGALEPPRWCLQRSEVNDGFCI